MEKIAVFWFRRDLRLIDNKALYHALKENETVLPIFIFDTDILNKFPVEDRRVSFIYDQLQILNAELKKPRKAIQVFHGKPLQIFQKITEEFKLSTVYCNEDYEPDAIKRDKEISAFLKTKGIGFKQFTDSIIMRPGRVLTDKGLPYTVFTPFSRKWKSILCDEDVKNYPSDNYTGKFIEVESAEIQYPEGKSPVLYTISKPKFNENLIRNYHSLRDFPAKNGCSGLGIHFRFGTISIRQAVKIASQWSETWLNELIWREFFIHILYLFPYVENRSFRKEYDLFPWLNNEEDFERWKNGETGYPLVDAGMRELNATGYMHNRVRMVTAGFLTKHLLIDWRWGETYFAEKLMDYELSSNNGNWQWAAGTGCDAAPYFRIFNPESQAKKFDPNNEYILQYIPELGSKKYMRPIIEHGFARIRCLDTFKSFKAIRRI
ncbi:MAG: deoxyribodipyrimidine photo-lyase [Bacteroidales bacterium]|nr:deoxyribodipyrimidine photo-lyase [Bacteroidales bacterium]